MTERLHCWISGLVQGVGFRWFARRYGSHLGLQGFARNLSDGRVEVLAEGPRADLEVFLVQLRQGPPGARVDSCDVQFEPSRGDLEPFDIHQSR